MASKLNPKSRGLKREAQPSLGTVADTAPRPGTVGPDTFVGGRPLDRPTLTTLTGCLVGIQRESIAASTAQCNTESIQSPSNLL